MSAPSEVKTAPAPSVNGRLVFSGEWKKEPVEIGSRRFWIVQASAGAAVRFRDATLLAARMVDGKLAGWQHGLNTAETQLVADCLYRPDPKNGELVLDGDLSPSANHRASADTVAKLPLEVQTALFDWVKANSPGLVAAAETPETLRKQIDALTARLAEVEKGDTAEARAKNGQEPSGPTS